MGCPGIISHYSRRRAICHHSERRLLFRVHYVGGSSIILSFAAKRTYHLNCGPVDTIPQSTLPLLAREGQVLLELQNGNKPRRPHDSEGHTNDVLWNKINECWAANPIDRPTSDSVAQFLDRQFRLEKSMRLH